MSLADRQRVLARFLVEPDYEARVREAPGEVATEERVSEDYVRRVAAIEPRRVAAFRGGRHRKAERREEKG